MLSTSSNLVREGGKLSVSLSGAAALCTKPVATFLAWDRLVEIVERLHCNLVEIMVLLC